MYDQYSDSNDEDHNQSMSSASTGRPFHSASIEEISKPKILQKSPKKIIQTDPPTYDEKTEAKVTEKNYIQQSPELTGVKTFPDRKRETQHLSNSSSSDEKQIDNMKSASPAISTQMAQQPEKFQTKHANIKSSLSSLAEQKHYQFNQERFNHYSFTCHLFPRLSQSNLQFHDINWYKDTITNSIILRKRRVCVNKLIKSICIRLTDHQTQQQRNFRANFSLLDRRPFAKRQIVSNIYSIPIPNAEGNPMARVFRKNPVSTTLLIRSNYRQHEVALQIVVESITDVTTVIVGRVELDLLNKEYKEVVGNRTHVLTFDGDTRFEFDTTDVAQRQQLETDSLPDVLICDERWIPMLAIYRQLLCERLSEDGGVFADRTTWILDPLVATFPALLDTDRNAIELLLLLMNKFEVFNILTPKKAVDRFRIVYMKFMLPFLTMANNGNWREQLNAYAHGKTNKEPDTIKAFSIVPHRKLNIYEYVINLCGTHSID